MFVLASKKSQKTATHAGRRASWLVSFATTRSSRILRFGAAFGAAATIPLTAPVLGANRTNQMPLFRLKCQTCGKLYKFLEDSRPTGKRCSKCDVDLVTDSRVSSGVVEVLDNGLMPKKVERLENVQDLRRDHAKVDAPISGDPEIV